MVHSIAVLSLLTTLGAIASASDRAAVVRKAADGIVDAELSPRHTFELADRRVRVHVEPHEDNRLLRLELEAGDFFRSTEIPLDGAGAAKSHWITWRSVPPGPYTFTATVYGSTGIRGRRIQRQSDPALGRADVR